MKRKLRSPVQIGLDGWPVGQSAADIEREDRVWHYRRKLEKGRHLEFLRKAFTSQNYFPAVMDAIAHCRREDLPMPDWLLEIVIAHLSYHYTKHKKLSKRCEAITKKRSLHMDRYGLIDEARMHGIKWSSRKADADIFEAAAERSGENAHTIRASYRKVAAALKRGRAYDFYVAEFRKGPIGVKKPTKKR